MSFLWIFWFLQGFFFNLILQIYLYLLTFFGLASGQKMISLRYEIMLSLCSYINTFLGLIQVSKYVFNRNVFFYARNRLIIGLKTELSMIIEYFNHFLRTEYISLKNNFKETLKISKMSINDIKIFHVPGLTKNFWAQNALKLGMVL